MDATTIDRRVKTKSLNIKKTRRNKTNASRSRSKSPGIACDQNISNHSNSPNQIKRGRRPPSNRGVGLSKSLNHQQQQKGKGDFQRRPPSRVRSMDSEIIQRKKQQQNHQQQQKGKGDFQRRSPPRIRSMDSETIQRKKQHQIRQHKQNPNIRQVRSMSPTTMRRGKSTSPSDTAERNKTNASRSRSKSPGSACDQNINNHSKSPNQIKRGRRPPSNRGVGLSKSLNQQQRKGDFQRRPPSRVRSMDQEIIQREKQRQIPQHKQNANIRQVRSMSPTPMRRGRSMSPSGERSIKDARGKNISQGGSDKVKEYPSQQDARRNQKYRRKNQGLYRSIRRSISKRKELTWCKLAQYLVPIFILIFVAIGVIFATGNGSIISDTLGGLIPILDNSELNDPYSDGDAPHWPQDGNGLKATIINALSDEWQTTFALAVADWNNGEPDAVDIFEEKGTYSPNCEAPDGKIIVCNGDYGDSKWRGINEAMIDYRGEIVSTSARMNEYYLSHMDSGAWQYTMCHELGHTLGLGHTDEDFDNEDLGNCMDYTNNLGVNKHPDTMNYETLLLLYGPISGRQLQGGRMRRRKRKNNLNLHTHWITATEASEKTNTVPLGHVSELRLRRGSNNKNSRPQHVAGSSSDNIDVDALDFSTVPDYIHTKKRKVVKNFLDNRRNNDHNSLEGDGWKIVHRKLRGEEYELYLGEGYKVRIQLLLV